MTHRISPTIRSGRTTATAVGTFLAVGTLSLGPLGGLARAADGATCVPTVDAPTLVVEPGPVAIGGTVEVTGAGWCHPTDGGSAIALKIDEGAYSRLDTAVHRNQTIWTVVQADPADGTFTLDMQLPDGTTATSEPAFASGTHTLRALTGSIKAGDVARSVQSSDFVVGEHRPQGIPDTVGLDQLTPAAAGGVKATRDGRRLSLTVPGRQADDWVFVSLLAADGSPRYPWGATWHRLLSGGRLTLGPGDLPVSGPHRVVVQDGNLGHVGELVGWDSVAYPVPKPKPAPGQEEPTPKGGKSGTTPTSPSAPSPPPAAPVAALPVAAPAPGAVATVPTVLAAPAATWGALKGADQLKANLTGTELVVSTGREGAQLFVHIYDATSSAAAGWTTTDDVGRARLDLAPLPRGDYRFTLVDADGELIGWAGATLGDAVAPREDALKAAVVPTAATPEVSMVSTTDGWLAGLGAALLAGALIGRGRKEKAA